MTLALTGKTPRRRTVLVLAAFFAIIGATLGGLWWHAGENATAAGSAITMTDSLGAWNNVNISDDSTLTGVGTQEIRWGTPTGGGSKSGYRFDGAGAGTHDLNTVFLVGKFTHFNQPIFAPSITGARLDVTLPVSSPFSTSAVVKYQITHDETPNSDDPCAYGGANGSGVNVNGCADKATVVNAPADQTFAVGEDLYILKMNGFERSTDGTCPATPTGMPVLEFLTIEKQVNYGCLYAHFEWVGPAVTIKKTAVTGTVDAGAAVEFDVSVHNGGTYAATGYTVSDTLPSGYTWTKASGDAGCTVTSNVLNCSFDSIAIDATKTVRVHGVPDSATSCGTVNNTAVLHKTGRDDVQSSASVTVNCPRNGFIEVYKVVTNVTGDATLFDASIDGGTSFTFSELAYSGNHPVPVGAHTVTELAETGYTTLGWALGTPGGNPVCPVSPTSNAGLAPVAKNVASIDVLSNNTTIVCFYNEVQPGHIEVHKVVTNVTGDTTVFDGDYGTGTGFTFSEAGSPGYWGSNQVAAGPYTVTEHPETGYVTKGWALATGNPADRCPEGLTLNGTDNTAEITVVGANTTVLCFFNERQDRLITITKEVVDNGIAPSNEGGQFKYDIRVNGTKVGEASLTDYEGGGTASTTVSLASLGVADPLNAKVTIAEWGMRPTGWVDDAMFPQNDIVGWETMNGTANLGTDHNAVTFRNKRGVRDITVCKLVAENGDTTDDGGTFHFDVRYGGTTTPYPVQSTFIIVGEEGTVHCTDSVVVPTGVNVEIVEWMGAIGRPAGWNGDTPGYPKYDFDDSGNSTVGETALVGPNVSKVTFANRTNTRTGSITLHKVIEIGSSTNPDDPNPEFSGMFDIKPWGPLHDGDATGIIIEVPAGNNHVITEDPGTVGQPGDTLWRRVGYFAPNSAGVCPTTGGGTTLDPDHISVAGGQTTTVCVLNHRNQPNEVRASVNVIKVVTGSVATTDAFDIALTTNAVGGANGTASVTGGTGHLFPIGLDTDHHDATFSVSETPRAGYTLLGYKLLVGGQGCPAPGGTYLSSVTDIPIGTSSSMAYTVCVYNEPLVTINVHKTEQNGLITTNGAGWKVTLSGCGMTPETKLTDALGNASFANKPLCATYLVSEDLTSKAPLLYFVAGGYQSSYAVNATTAGQAYSVLFANVLWSPPDFIPTPTPQTPVITPTPETPTATPETPTATVTQPAVVITPTATPTEAEAVEGEKTPGQQATPIAPETGSGGGASGGMNIVLAGLGLAAMSIGLGSIALGKRRIR